MALCGAQTSVELTQPTVQGALDGWASGIESSKKVTGLRAEFKQVVDLFVDSLLAKKNRRVTSWVYKQEGSKFRLEHTSSNGVVRMFATDGTNLYSLTRDGKTYGGARIAAKDPVAKKEFFSRMELESSGGWYSSLASLYERPENYNGKSLLRGYRSLTKELILRPIDGSSFELSLPLETARKAALPTRIVLKRIGDNFYPTNVTDVFPSSGSVKTLTTVLGPYSTVGSGVVYPESVVSTVTQKQGDGPEQELARATTVLRVNTGNRFAASDFRIGFPAGTQLYNGTALRTVKHGQD